MNAIQISTYDRKIIEKVLHEISRALTVSVEDENEGLLTGCSGVALFYAYYYRLTGKRKHLLALHRIILKVIQTMGEKEMSWSHCSGISGIAWCIKHLIDNGFVEEGMDDIFSELDEHLFSFMKEALSSGHYDFLHEGLGVILYFLSKLPDSSAQSYLEEAVTGLEKQAVVNQFGTCWKDNFTQKGKTLGHAHVYNLGLAHGVPSVISVLTLLYQKNISISRTLPLIKDAIKWMMSTRNEPGDNCLSLYPTIVSTNNKAIGNKQSRLGWCYGDLGIAVTLWNAGTRLQNEDYKREARKIFDHTQTWRDKENGSIRDACLCHGAMGISHMFRRVYLETGDAAYATTAERWLQEALAMATWKDGPAGFKNLVEQGYQNSYNLLEGIAGIGLGLIAALDKETDPAWDRCLLLS